MKIQIQDETWDEERRWNWMMQELQTNNLPQKDLKRSNCGKGIKQQIEEANIKQFEFGNLSMLMFKEFLKDLKSDLKIVYEK